MFTFFQQVTVIGIGQSSVRNEKTGELLDVTILHTIGRNNDVSGLVTETFRLKGGYNPPVATGRTYTAKVLHVRKNEQYVQRLEPIEEAEGISIFDKLWVSAL